jgi:ribose-phosphate pyrophosphokinase
MSDPVKTLLFSTEAYSYLALEIARALKKPPGKLECKRFPDGERYLRILSDVRGQDALLVGGTVSDEATLDLYDIASGLVNSGCRKLTLIVPYFGYSTMERAVKPGEVVTAKNRARLLSFLPRAPFGNHIVLLDLHSEGIPFYFENETFPLHLYAKKLVLDEAKKRGGKSFSLACVDAGRAKWVQSLANDLGVPASFVYKKRIDSSKTEVSAVSASVSGKNVIIYDDMIRTGSSVIEAARAYKTAGAKSIHVICTHGLFVDLSKLKKSGVIEGVTCTDSHPHARATPPLGGFLTVLPLAPLFADYLKGAKLETH